ncbi:SDR family NAD(P)-dependent oxidoreductase [Falsiroseomonas sp.]|uniref:SDR family NAD(P)-dependent oxidoreductase n=1 Tax=Falsiroseomonas sp. TaxID=2870721 RepID=UPI0034A30D07
MSRRIALVTGAGDGLGRAIALDLARHGYDLVVTDLDTGLLKTTVEEASACGARVLPVVLDLRRQDSIEAALEAAAALGPLDLLVNNAAFTLNRPAIEFGWDEYDAVMDVNLKGTYFLTTGYARRCIATARAGAVVMLASTHGLTGLAGRSVYGISKGGIVQMTRMLAIEWAERGVRVNAVAPATVITPSRAQMLADPARRAAMLERLPQRRFPTAEDVAAAVRYLGGAEAASVTGQILAVDGGLTAA